MPVHVHIKLPAEHDRKSERPHHEHGDVRPGWAEARQPKDEPHVANKNMSLGRWLKRASEHSGPQYAPGIGVRKSSQ